jgi:hypothetical protein
MGWFGAEQEFAGSSQRSCLPVRQTRFGDAFRRANLEETLAGRIVLSIGCDMRGPGVADPAAWGGVAAAPVAAATVRSARRCRSPAVTHRAAAVAVLLSVIRPSLPTVGAGTGWVRYAGSTADQVLADVSGEPVGLCRRAAADVAGMSTLARAKYARLRLATTLLYAALAAFAAALIEFAAASG